MPQIRFVSFAHRDQSLDSRQQVVTAFACPFKKGVSAYWITDLDRSEIEFAFRRLRIDGRFGLIHGGRDDRLDGGSMSEELSRHACVAEFSDKEKRRKTSDYIRTVSASLSQRW